MKISNIREDSNNLIFISNASLWEIAIKVSIGKLKLKGSLKDLKGFLDEKGFEVLDFDISDLEVMQNLPFYHQDPFDRLIVAQGKSKSIEIITDDWQVQKYLV